MCLLWFAIASVLEWLQSGAGSAWFIACVRLGDEKPLMASLGDYAVHGQFDGIELIATSIGCLCDLAVTTTFAPNSKWNQSIVAVE